MKTGIELIAAERQRQLDVEGYDAAHDDEHVEGEIALAAALYASPILLYAKEDYANQIRFSDPWPWEDSFDRRAVVNGGNVIAANSTLGTAKRIRQLEKAGALIAAEIDRLRRSRTP